MTKVKVEENQEYRIKIINKRNIFEREGYFDGKNIETINLCCVSKNNENWLDFLSYIFEIFKIRYDDNYNYPISIEVLKKSTNEWLSIN